MLCQDLLHGRNKRQSVHRLQFAGGLFRCAHCGMAATGERIRRKLRGGGVKEHTYYRCGGLTRPEDHPIVRWREDEIEEAVIEELESLRIPSPRIADWFRASLAEAFANVEDLHERHATMLAKRKSALTGMQERLLNSYLTGLIDEEAFEAKATELKRELASIEEAVAAAAQFDPEASERAMAIFDFSQNLADLWRGSDGEDRRAILECVTLNRTVSDVTICLEKRKPFGFLAERPFFKNGRGDRI